MTCTSESFGVGACDYVWGSVGPRFSVDGVSMLPLLAPCNKRPWTMENTHITRSTWILSIEIYTSISRACEAKHTSCHLRTAKRLYGKSSKEAPSRKAFEMDLIFSLTRSAWMLIPVKEKYDHDPMPKNPFPAFGASLILCMVSMLQDIVLESWNHSFFPFTPLSHRPDPLTTTLAYALDMTPQQRMRLSV